MRLPLSFLFAFPLCLSAEKVPAADVVVYGATPGGIAAAVAAAKDGMKVSLVEPTGMIGGLATSGLSHTDFHSFESLSGSFADFARRVEAHYVKTYGADSPQVRDCFRGTFGEPKVNLLAFEAMLSGHGNISVIKGAGLKTVAMDGNRITSATFTGKDGELTLTAPGFIDATYEGDLMAAAGVPWRTGREGRAEYGEPLAPEHADSQLQAYNFRLIMTDVPENRVPVEMPAGYRREDFLPLIPVLESGAIRKVFGYPSQCIFKAQTPPLPNGKYDINDVSGGLVRLSLPGKNTGWPRGRAEERAAIFAEHARDQIGLLYFLQNDGAVPARFRDEARRWGLCKDEFPETGHLPPQLYVREARRMRGMHVYVQEDSAPAPGDARARFFHDAVAMGDYGNNCHGTFHEGPRFGGKHTGEFYNPVPPYQIPYGVIVPDKVENLLVPVAASSSHVGFCALRLEPIWMSLGQAAGHAAAMVVGDAHHVRAIDVAALQEKLIAERSALAYFGDVPLDSADFPAAQWWAAQGGFHGIDPAQKNVRGPKIHGQYNHAAPGHEAKLDAPLDGGLRERWLALAKSRGVDEGRLAAAATAPDRRSFIAAIFPKR